MCFCVCVCLCVCVVSNQSTSKKPHYVSDLSKLIGLIVYPPRFLLGGGRGVWPITKKICTVSADSLVTRPKSAETVRPMNNSPSRNQAKSPHFTYHKKSSQPIHSANLLIGFHKRRAPINRYINQIYNKN